MKASDEINALLRSAKELRRVADGELDKFRREHQNADKTGFGFNLDDRFRNTSKHTLSYDSWVGYYGGSSCSKWLSINDSVRFWKFFDDWVNSHQREILGGIADRFEKEARQKVEELRAERDELTQMLAALGDPQ